MKKRYIAILAMLLCLLTLIITGCAEAVTTDDTEEQSNNNEHNGSEDLNNGIGTISNTPTEWAEFVLSRPLYSGAALEGNVEMVVLYDNISENIIKIEIRNNSEYTLITGVDFVIEKFKEDAWWRVPWSNGIAEPWLLIGHFIYAGESIEMMKDTNLFEPLLPGVYRVRKRAYIDDTPWYIQNHEFVAEFRRA